MRTPLIVAWIGVGLYLLAFVIDAVQGDFQFALEWYSGYFWISNFDFPDTIEGLLLQPGMLIVLLTIAILLTTRSKKR